MLADTDIGACWLSGIDEPVLALPDLHMWQRESDAQVLIVQVRQPARTKCLDLHTCRFALISDSDVPLYDPLTFYQQLMHEPLSRVRACCEFHGPWSFHGALCRSSLTE